jgi:hypothetical protein
VCLHHTPHRRSFIGISRQPPRSTSGWVVVIIWLQLYFYCFLLRTVRANFGELFEVLTAVSLRIQVVWAVRPPTSPRIIAPSTWIAWLWKWRR